MANPNFTATMSSNEIWRGTDNTRCITDDLDAIEADIAALEQDKADENHTHSYEDLSDVPTIPTIPASLPANGGNADTVDDKHASDFAESNHTHKTDSPLWSGSSVLIATDIVTPSKALSACQSGWLLLWSDANNTGGGNDYDYCTTVIPKKNATGGNWGTKAFFCVLPRYSDPDGDGINIKTIKISDTAITGDVKNNQCGREDMVLRAVYEF